MDPMASSAVNSGFGRALKGARKARGLTQEDFTDVSGRTYVSALERGLKSPTLEKISALAQALELHPLTLVALAYARRGENVRMLLARVEREAAALERQ